MECLSQEQLLEQIGRQGSLPDTRVLYPGKAVEDNGTWDAEAFKQNGQWQQQLLNIIKSLHSRDVSRSNVSDIAMLKLIRSPQNLDDHL